MPEYGPLTCAGCGLLCDDVTAERSGQDVRLRPACRLGGQWLAERWSAPAGAPAATINGEPADLAAALARAGELLRAAHRPLVHGFDRATVEDTRAALALADRLGALVVTDRLGDDWPGAPAVALRGEASATLGEIRDRSQVVVVWREDPETTHPRLLQRLGFGIDATPTAGAGRILIVCDDRDTATAERADLRLSWPRERDLEALVGLHVRQREVGPGPGELSAQLDALTERISAVPHLAFVYGAGLTSGGGGQRRALALHELVRSLCSERHAVTLALPRAAGTTGAQDVLAWQTGYGANVDLARGHPELIAAARPPGSGEGVDVSLRIEGAAAQLGAGVAEIALCSRPADTAGSEPDVSIRTAAAGIEAPGTAHRLDGVPVSLRSPLPGDAPTAASLLRRLLDEVAR